MTVREIVRLVRLALDEEAGYEDYETVRMDNIIRSRAWDALRWTLMNVNGNLLNGGDVAGGGGFVVDETADVVDGIVELPASFVKLIRVRGTGWSRAVMKPVSEDSEEYLMQSDETARADTLRPQAALIETSPNRLELFPHYTGKCSVTYVTCPSDDGSVGSDSDTVNVPPKARTAYVYYLAYLVMVAYGDASKAEMMLSTAKMNAGVVVDG